MPAVTWAKNSIVCCILPCFLFSSFLSSFFSEPQLVAADGCPPWAWFYWIFFKGSFLLLSPQCCQVLGHSRFLNYWVSNIVNLLLCLTIYNTYWTGFSCMQVNGQYGETKTDSICQNLISKQYSIRLLLAFPTLINSSLNSSAENKKLIRYPEILSIIKPWKVAHSP